MLDTDWLDELFEDLRYEVSEDFPGPDAICTLDDSAITRAKKIIREKIEQAAQEHKD